LETGLSGVYPRTAIQPNVLDRAVVRAFGGEVATLQGGEGGAQQVPGERSCAPRESCSMLMITI
jgi:hypothetical protein